MSPLILQPLPSGSEKLKYTGQFYRQLRIPGRTISLTTEVFFAVIIVKLNPTTSDGEKFSKGILDAVLLAVLIGLQI
ncbi:hypothetical protein KCTCHS21_61050 [Cohnella abietis]|uniref:Uncharacterized protein n=1 Tax=Cohnella abietis TaxID=2507935 RepID=A0A3T1DEW5_9BACL|nr:hypothetical protein KCTCHS21_61050 [Cohnella abietis]